jgi:apolipoprotein N-acyltransferase
MLTQAETNVSDSTEFLLLPETAIAGWNIESQLTESEVYEQLQNFIQKHPNITIVTGYDSYEISPDQVHPKEFASYAEGVGFYEPYNAALIINKEGYQIYHKSKFVPGAEQVPFPTLIKPIESILGGVGFGHFFGQDKQEAYKSLKGYKAAPSICYESIFGEHMAEFVQNGAQVLFIITNDDWWNDTEGHRHHYEYARLRAIEARMSIARSANTGFSGYFDALGDDTQKTEYRQPACLLQKIDLQINKEVTFYVKYGDYLGKVASLLFILLFISLLVKRFTLKN